MCRKEDPTFTEDFLFYIFVNTGNPAAITSGFSNVQYILLSSDFQLACAYYHSHKRYPSIPALECFCF